MASFADVMKKIAANSVKAAGNAVNRSVGASRTQEKPNQPGYDPNLAAAQAAAGYVPPQLAQMQPMQNAEEEQQDETENSKLRNAFGNVAKAIAGDIEGQEKTLSEDELKAMQSPVDQFLSSFAMGPENAYAATGAEEDNGDKNNPLGNLSKEQYGYVDIDDYAKGYLNSHPIAGLDLSRGLAYQDWDKDTRERAMSSPSFRSALMNQEVRNMIAEERALGNKDYADYINLRNRNMRIPDELNTEENQNKYNQAYADLYARYEVPEDKQNNLPDSDRVSGKPGGETAKSGRGQQNTILSDYYDYLQTPEGKEWADLYSDLGYTDEETGLANLLASGDTEAFMQLLGGSDGWNGSERLRARYNNSIPDFYDWRSGEFNDNARDMLADYLWGDQAISALGLAEGTDYLGRTLSPEDAALLAQWSNYLADNAGFGNPMNNYNLDARDAALFLYATAMTGDNPLNFDQDVTNHMLERAGITQRVGQTGDDNNAALPTLTARKYSIPDLYAANTAENALKPILDNKNTGYYDAALLASIVAAANADNSGKYGIYDI